MSDEAVTVESDDEATLYSQIVEATGIEYDTDTFDSVEKYKDHLVNWFADDDEGDARYENSPGEVQEWVDAATRIAKANKQARRKKAMPIIDGLDEEPEPEDEPRRGRGGGRTRVRLREKKPRDKTDNRYGHTARLLFKNPSMTFDEVMDELERTGKDYSDVTIRYVYDAYTVFHAVGVEMGMIKK